MNTDHKDSVNKATSVTAADTHSQFEQRAQALLRDSVEHLDGRTLSRLTQARHAALEAAKGRSLLGSWGGWNWKLLAPISMAAAAMVLAMTLTMNPSQHTLQSTIMANNLSDESANDLPDKLEIIAAEDSLEFYRDVDFYAWLDAELDEDGNAAPVELAVHEQTKA
jgi:hypothetical protein